VSVGSGGAAVTLGGDTEATGADGWRVPAEVAGALDGVAGDFCVATGIGPTRGAGASCEKFGRPGAMALPGTGGIACRAGDDGAAEVSAGAVGAVAAGRGRTGGVIATAAPRSTCGEIATAAGATWLDSTRTRAGTTVAAARFANCWLATCGGGSAAVGCAAIIVLILVMLTLVILTLRM
jgi:hypothetical protein